jgi:hypothetical protein
MNSQRLIWLTRVCVSAAFIGGLFSGGAALADPILPGFDLLSTPPFDLQLQPGGPIVRMAGDPIGPGNTDTIVQRHAPGPPEGATGTIPIELVALSLSSVTPVVLDFGTGAQPYDVHIGLLPSQPSLGQMSIQSHLAGHSGGTFDSFFDVFTDLTFTPTGGGSPIVMPRQDALSSTGSPWSHVKPPHYPENAQFPSGGFYPGVLPGTNTVVGIDHTGPHPHTDPSTPEPTGFVLATIALAGALSAFRRARKG